MIHCIQKRLHSNNTLCGMNSIIKNKSIMGGPWMLSRMGFPPSAPSTYEVGYVSLVSASWDEESTSIHWHMAITQGPALDTSRKNPPLPWRRTSSWNIHCWLYLSYYQASIEDTEIFSVLSGSKLKCLKSFFSERYHPRCHARCIYFGLLPKETSY